VSHDDGANPVRSADLHRRQAAYLYGLIVSGAVLATSGDSSSLTRVTVGLVLTLLIYWAAETYAHLMAARMVHRGDLTRAERWQIAADGWPLVTACAVPVVLLLVEAVLGVETGRAVQVALLVNAAVLVLVGYAMSRASGLTGWRLVFSATLAGLLGLAVVALKALLH
jgi:hypothetical protein